jgi:hypothetical protein
MRAMLISMKKLVLFSMLFVFAGSAFAATHHTKHHHHHKTHNGTPNHPHS